MRLVKCRYILPKAQKKQQAHTSGLRLMLVSRGATPARILTVPRCGGLSFVALERFNIENVQPLGKDLPANPCREFVAGGLCPP